VKKFLTLLRGPALFAMVGAVSTTADIFVFTLLNAFTGLIAGANVVSFSVQIVVAFLGNRSITFRDRAGREPFWIEAARYFLVSSSSLILSTVVVHIAAQFVPAFYAKLISLPFVFVWGYTVTSRFVFSEKRPKRRRVTSRTAP
jgi:putative flippase GtrA